MTENKIDAAASAVRKCLERNDAQGALTRMQSQIMAIEASGSNAQEKAEMEQQFFQVLRGYNKDLAARGFLTINVSADGKHMGVKGSDGAEKLYCDFDWTSYSKVRPDRQPKKDKDAPPPNTDPPPDSPSTLSGKIDKSDNVANKAKPGDATAVRPRPAEVNRSPDHKFQCQVDDNGFILFDQTQDFSGDKNVFSGNFVSDSQGHRSSIGLWFPAVPEFQPRPGHPIPVRGYLNSDPNGYGDGRQFHIDCYTGQLQLNRNGQVEFVGQLYDSSVLIDDGRGHRANPFWNVRVPLTEVRKGQPQVWTY